jgi:hypothetical protein
MLSASASALPGNRRSSCTPRTISIAAQQQELFSSQWPPACGRRFAGLDLKQF